jgi:hypothetical protein
MADETPELKPDDAPAKPVVDKALYAEGMEKAFPEGKPAVPAIANDPGPSPEPAAAEVDSVVVADIGLPSQNDTPYKPQVPEDLPIGAKTELQRMVNTQDAMGNTLVPVDTIPVEQPVHEDSYLQTEEGTILVSPIPPDSPENKARLGILEDPFPDVPFPPDRRENTRILISLNGTQHGGFIRNNPDGTWSWKPRSYIGPILTGADLEEIRRMIPTG